MYFFLYFFRYIFYGGEKFLHQKAVFFYFVNNSHSYWPKHTKLQPRLDNMFLHVILKNFQINWYFLFFPSLSLLTRCLGILQSPLDIYEAPKDQQRVFSGERFSERLKDSSSHQASNDDAVTLEYSISPRASLQWSETIYGDMSKWQRVRVQTKGW